MLIKPGLQFGELRAAALLTHTHALLWDEAVDLALDREQNIDALDRFGCDRRFVKTHQIAEVEQVANHVLMIDLGKLVLDAPMDRVKEQYRHIQAVFPEPVEERDFRLPGIEKVSVTGRTVSFVASHNVDSIVEHVRMLHAGSIDVLPISLKEIFLEKVKARS